MVAVMTKERLALGALLALAVWSCSGPVGSMVGDALVEVGTSLSDTSNDAARAEVFDAVPCREVVYIDRTITSPDGRISYQRSSQWFAEVEVSIDPSRITTGFAVACGLVRTEADSPACPTTATCTGPIGNPPPELDCVSATVWLDRGRVRAYCGYSLAQRQTAADGTVTLDSVTEAHRTTARITVE